MGRGGVSDANEKHSNKVARGALYCNSICTLMIGIVVLIVAAVNVMHTQRVRLCPAPIARHCRAHAASASASCAHSPPLPASIPAAASGQEGDR